MTLSDWQRNGWLRPHQATPAEIAELFEVARRDLDDAEAAGLSDDWRFAIAYNAALQLARLALLASGYDTPKGDSTHFRALQSLAFTIELNPETIRLLDVYRKKRASSVYEIAGRITSADAADIRRIARELETRVQQWIRSHYPTLLA